MHEPNVGMYVCGPTVYGDPHLGHTRPAITFDVLFRYLKHLGYKVRYVRNITDVGHLEHDADDGEDKIAKKARLEQLEPMEVVQFYLNRYHKAMDALNVQSPSIEPHASGHIIEQIEYIKTILDAGYAYVSDGSVYFDVLKYNKSHHYGELSGRNVDELLNTTRELDGQAEKHNPCDFALWKKADPRHIMQWDSPWGRGYPGWHIECSAMSKKYLGECFDIHSGGVDHIPIHHENEIAQNEAITGKQSVRFWMHGEFMLVDGGKMSKSLGNTYTVSDLEAKGYAPLDFRFFCLNTHYRKKLNFTFEGLSAAKTSRARLMNQLGEHKASNAATTPEKLEAFRASFRNAIEDDMNVPLALGVLFTAIKEPKSKDIYELAKEFDCIFGLDLQKAEAVKAEEESLFVPEEITALCEKRKAAKKDKNYALADELRAEIAAKGYAVTDTPQGYKVSKLG